MSELDQLVVLLNSAGYERYNPLNLDGGGKIGEMQVLLAQARKEIATAFRFPKSYLNTAEPKSLNGRVYPKELWEKVLTKA
jgi:hypothetical protein